jgi:hypothetical protein
MSAQQRAIAAALGSVALAALIGTAALPEAHSAPSVPSTDEHGFVDSSARCSASQTLMAYGRTSRALVVICVEPDGGLQYRGVRLSDGAALQMAAGRGSDGSIVALNEGVTYSVSPSTFLVSQGDTVLYRDSWTDFHQPRFSGGSTPSSTSPGTSTTATSSTAPSSSAPSSSEAAPATSPTVSTTIVTMTPTTSKPAG